MQTALTRYLQSVKTTPEPTFNGVMGMSLYSCDFASRQVVFQVDTDSWMQNPGRVVHGGISAAMLDMTMGALCRYFTGGSLAPTVSMQVNYLRAMPVHETILVRAELCKLGRSLCYTTGTAWVKGAEDAPLCTASGVYHAGQA